MIPKVLCFGELLLRFSPQPGGEWIRQSNTPVFIGGSELNVARALALWNVPVKYLTALPDNYLSREIDGYLSSLGIDTTSINYSGNRIGIYYLPEGVDLKNASVIYDRMYSSFSELKPGMIDWEKVLEDISWFHFSAISPSLSVGVADICEEALKVCIKKNITISLDLGYRSKLWQDGRRPAEVMPQLAKYCDIIMGNIWSAEIMLKSPLPRPLNALSTKDEYLQQALKTSKDIINRFPKCKIVANTFRFDEQKLNYFATLFANNEFLSSSEYSIDRVVDKSGSGDCFMAGLIYGYYNNKGPREILEFATAAAFGKLLQKGDSTQQNKEQVLEIISTYGKAGINH